MGSACSFCPWCDNGVDQEDDDTKEVTKEPANTSIRQQRTGGYYEENGEWVDNTFDCKCFAERCSEEHRLVSILIPIFIASLISAIRLFNFETPVILSERYDDLDCPTNGNPCIKRIVITKDMTAPIYFTYELVNFWQSHRVYLNSRSDYQLDGDVLNKLECAPSSSLNGKVVYPCGLLPQSVFTDRFFIDVERSGVNHSLCQPSSCPRHEDDISWNNYWDLFEENGTWERIGTWGGLADSKYKTPNDFPSAESYTRNSQFLNGTNLQLPYPTNSDLIVWLRTAVKPTFKKPFRVIKNFDFMVGDILNVNIFQYFNPGVKGEKHFTIETSPGFGPKTALLGAMCLGICIFSCCFLCFVVFSGSELICCSWWEKCQSRS